MFCNFCGKSVPQGEAYCDGCAPRARSQRPKEEREAELTEIKQGARSKQKLSSLQREEGKPEMVRAFLLILLGWGLVHYCYIFKLGQSYGGEALLDLGVLIFLLFFVSSRKPVVRILLPVRCLIFTCLSFYYAFSELMESPVPFAFFFIGGLLSLFSGVFILLSQPVRAYFEYEE